MLANGEWRNSGPGHLGKAHSNYVKMSMVPFAIGLSTSIAVIEIVVSKISVIAA